MSDNKVHKISHCDIQLIISYAKNQWVLQTLPMKVSRKLVEGNDPAHIAMVDSVIGYLNSKGLLNTFVKIDYDEK